MLRNSRDKLVFAQHGGCSADPLVLFDVHARVGIDCDLRLIVLSLEFTCFIILLNLSTYNRNDSTVNDIAHVAKRDGRLAEPSSQYLGE